MINTMVRIPLPDSEPDFVRPFSTSISISQRQIVDHLNVSSAKCRMYFCASESPCGRERNESSNQSVMKSATSPVRTPMRND